MNLQEFIILKEQQEKEFFDKIWEKFENIEREKLPSLKYIIDMKLFREYGKAINYAVKYNLNFSDIEIISRNDNIEKIVGKRFEGKSTNLLFEPFELGYFCSLCGHFPDLKKDGEIELMHLEFSEYRYFMYCKRCNIDIPSYICIQPKSKKDIKRITNTYLSMLHEVAEREQFKIGKMMINFLDNIKKNKFRKKKIINELESVIKTFPKRDPEWKNKI